MGGGGAGKGGSGEALGGFGNQQRQDLETLKYLNEQYHKKYGKNKSVDNNQPEKGGGGEGGELMGLWGAQEQGAMNYNSNFGGKDVNPMQRVNREEIFSNKSNSNHEPCVGSKKNSSYTQKSTANEFESFVQNQNQNHTNQFMYKVKNKNLKFPPDEWTNGSPDTYGKEADDYTGCEIENDSDLQFAVKKISTEPDFDQEMASMEENYLQVEKHLNYESENLAKGGSSKNPVKFVQQKLNNHINIYTQGQNSGEGQIPSKQRKFSDKGDLMKKYHEKETIDMKIIEQLHHDAEKTTKIEDVTGFDGSSNQTAKGQKSASKYQLNVHQGSSSGYGSSKEDSKEAIPESVSVYNPSYLSIQNENTGAGSGRVLCTNNGNRYLFEAFDTEGDSDNTQRVDELLSGM